jgi:hypothetical protein
MTDHQDSRRRDAAKTDGEHHDEAAVPGQVMVGGGEKKDEETQMYCTKTRWTKRYKDIEDACQTLREWAVGSSIDAGLPDNSNTLYKECLFPPKGTYCACRLCEKKRNFIVKLHHFHAALANLQAERLAEQERKNVLKERRSEWERRLERLLEDDDSNETNDPDDEQLKEQVRQEFASCFGPEGSIPEALFQHLVQQRRKYLNEMKELREWGRGELLRVRQETIDAELSDEEPEDCNRSVLAIRAQTAALQLYLVANTVASVARSTCWAHENENDFLVSMLARQGQMTWPHFDTESPIQFAAVTMDGELKRFAELLQNSFQQAHAGTETRHQRNVLSTVQAILNWDPVQPIQHMPDAGNPFQAKTSHSMQCAVLFQIASIINDDRRKKFESNFASCVLRERACFVKSNFSIRNIDFVTKQVEEQLRRDLVHVHFAPLGVEPLPMLHDEGVSHVSNRLTERIQQFFHLGGVGINHLCRGAVLTQISVDILEMELLDVATEKVKVQLRRTEPHFLFDESTTKILLGTNDLPDFKSDGFGLLAALMRISNSPSSDETSSYPRLQEICYREANSKEEYQLTGFLGVEGLSRLFGLDTNSFVHMSKSPECTLYLIEEMQILRKLEHENIPK